MKIELKKEEPQLCSYTLLVDTPLFVLPRKQKVMWLKELKKRVRDIKEENKLRDKGQRNMEG